MKCRVFIQFAVSIALMGGFVACDSDDPKPEPGIEVVDSAAILGRVYNKSTFEPVEGAIIMVDNKEVARSISDGVFSFACEDNKKITFTVSHSGYFTSTVVVDHAADDHVGDVAYANIALMEEVLSMDVDPTKDLDILLGVKNSAPGVHVHLPANVLSSEVKSILPMNYVLSQINSYGAFYMKPWGTPLASPVEVSFTNSLPSSVYYDGIVVTENGEMTGLKSNAYDVKFDAIENAYKFIINSFGNYVMNVNIAANVGQTVIANSPYQTLVVDNACGQNTVYEWKKCVKSVSGYEVKTNIETTIKNKFAGISADEAHLIQAEVLRIIKLFKNSAPSKVEREVCTGTVKINPGTINIYKSYLATRTSTITLSLVYKGNIVKLEISLVDYLGVKGSNEAISCSDHSGGGTN